jgi:phage terminase large subunit-like protein
VVGGKAHVGKLSHGYVLGDYSTPHGSKTSIWAKAILNAYHKHEADEIIVEGNHGAAAVEEVIRLTQLTDYKTGETIVDGRFLKITMVNASRGKRVRAEPVAVVYEEGRGHMVGEFPMLEKELTTWLVGDASPNRLDALVWAFVGMKLINEKPPPAGVMIEQEHESYKSDYDSGRRLVFRR